VPSAAELLRTAAAQAAARLAELDAVAVDQRARMTYTDGQQQYGWNEYRAALLAQVKDTGAALESLAKADQVAAGPFTVRSGGVRG
jgi:hypothetical protein